MTAFEQLTATHADRLFAVVLRLVGNRSDADDVVQETLLRAWRGIGRFQGRSMYFTWLYRIALNEANRCEAADIVGIGEAAFKSRLHEARLKVRATLGDAALIEAAG